MNRQFTINDVFMPGITGGEPDRVRQAFHAPDLLSGSEIGQRDNAAEQLGMSYGEADAGWEDASAELKIRKAEAVPGADKWVQDAPENVTFLQEDADGLMAVYDSLRQSGFLSEDDLDEGTAEEIAQSGHGLVDTLERSRLANERADLGAAVLEGSLTPEEARAKLADIDNRMAALAKRRNDPAGFYSFVEQGYRMVSRDLPQAGYRALEGGLAGATAGMAAGAIAGTAVPVVGNLTGAVGGGVAGGIAGVGAGISRGMYESAQRMESANFLADLLNEKDDAGNYLDVDEIREKAQLYGMGSALVEMAGDALSVGATKLIAPFLKTAAANLGGRTLSLFTKDAIKAAIKNKQAWPVMRRFLLGMGAGAAAEGAEEAVQEGVSASIEAWLKNSLNEEGKAYFRDEQEGLFSAETWAAMAENGLEGAKVGAWFVLLPGIAQLFVDAGKVSRAREFAQGVKDVGSVVANSATAQMAPARMDTFLQTHGLNQTVYIPADAAWQMQTQGTDLVTALGWTQESLEEAASLRHDIAVPLSRLVSRLDTGTLNAVADIMREGPNAMNVFEADEPNSFLQEDVDAINAAAEEWEFEQDMLDAELDRVRSAITEAVRSVPGLLQQIVGSADTETSVGTYVDTIVTLIEQAANRLRVYGDDVGSIIQKLNFEGLVRGADGRLRTAEEIEQMVAEEAQAEVDRPFWDNVWGRLDADSLKRDFPEARRELAKKHGYGLFSRKGEGIAVDELADILKNAGWLDKDADSSTLVEMLKSKKRPKARKAVKADPALRQTEWVSQASIEAVRVQYENTDGWMKAPNGKPTNLTERQWLQVRTPEFKAWFGDWENDPANASKVVDENGEPKVVWHGTRKAGFDVFDTDGSGKTAGTGAWFAGRKVTATTYSGTRTEMDVFDDDGELVVEDGYANYPVFLNIRNPYTYAVGGRNWDNIGGVSIYDMEEDDYIYNYPDGRPFDFPYEDAAWDYVEDELGDPDHERYEVQWSEDTTDSVAREVRSGWMGDEFDGVIFEDVMDSGSHGELWHPDTDYIAFSPEQIKSASHNIGSFDPNNPSILYQSYTELDDQRRGAVDAWLDAHPDGAEIREQLELHRGTPWEAQAVESILIRIAMNDIMEGRGHPSFETKLGAKSAEGVVKYLRRGEEGLWQYLSEKGMIGEAAKPGLDVNGSFIACRPSDDCARYCYAAKGQYKYVAPAVKSELIAWAVEHNPARAAQMIARQYMATMEYDAGKALRLFDKGDISQEWVPLVQELNRRGVRTQVFSKRPEILRQLDPEMNVIMLSIDKTNWNMADEHPDLPIAFVYSGREDLPFLEKNEERFKAHGGVILPVMQGRKTLPKEDLEALPKWSRRYACPIDSGKKTLYNKTSNPGGWKCAHCDRDGGIGCFYGRTALPNYKEIKENGLFVETGKREETGGRGHIDEANLYELFRAASVEDRQRILDGLALIHAELRERDIDRAEGALLPTFGGVDGRASFGNRSGAGPDAAGRVDEDTLFQAVPQDNKAFKQWFKKSKAVDASGQPLDLYHGSNAQIGDDFAFDYRFIGAHGSAEGYGFYLTTDEVAASIYDSSENALDMISELAVASGNKKNAVTAVRDVTGFDGVVSNGYGNRGEAGGTIYVAWFPEQIKSVDNHGEFSPEDPRIYYQSQTYKTAEIQRLDDGDFLIRLFRGANLSTLAHEISHAVHLEMERLDSEGKGTDALKRDLDTLRRWQSKYDDEAALRAEYDRYYKGLYGVEFDDLDAVGKLAVKQRAQREMVARGFELYLREGEAPTPGMEAVFRRMGKWMKRVYASASQLDVEISDDVREVFDRMVASDEDIAAAAAANNLHADTAPLLDALGLQGADRLEVEGMVADAMGKASDALRRERARYRRDHVQQWRDEVEQELAADPVYQARAAMRRTPIDLDAVVDAYGQELADALRVKLPASMKKGGDNPEALAFDYGFRDAGQMIQAILNRPGTQERRKELLAQKMQDADAQFVAEDFLFEQEELRNREDRIGEALYRLELESRTAMGRPVSPSQQEFEDFGSAEKNRWKIAREQLRTLVSNLLDEKEAQAAIQPDSYRRAASKAMRDERRAILAKDWAEAVKQNYLARVNMEAAYQAGKRRDLVNKLRRQAKRFLDSATPDTRARFAVFGLSQKISLFDPTMKMVQNAADKSLDDVREFLEKMKDEGFYTVDAQIPEELFEGKKQSWKLMNWKDLQPYLEGMAVLMHMERESRKANSEDAKQAWREEMDAMAEGILALNPHRNPPADQKKRLDILRFLKGVHASHLKAETIALLLDGDQDMGPVWRAVIAPINRAQADRDRRMKQARDEMKKLFSVYEPSEWVDMRGKRIFVPGLGRGLTKEQMLAVMLNAGNESNLERLRGMGYTDEQIRAIIDMLDERDVRFVQSVWDYLETFRKESFDLEESLSGVRPQAIEAKPLQTRFGELRGGYYPVSYDPQESSKPIDEESLGTLTGSMMPAVDHGSMKQRTATGLGTPLKLTLEVVPNHVAKTLHMLAFREPVRQVARVLNDKAVNAAIESTMGVEISKALKGWLHYVAGERPGVNGWSKALSMLRKNSALYSMGVKLTTILAQFTGLLASTAEIGPRWVAAGLARTYCRQNPFTVYRETAALSPMMENRMKSVDRDLYEMSTGLMAKGSSNKVLDKFVKFQHLQEQYAFLPVGFVQMAFADLPTWQGAYAKAIHEGKSQSEAIEYADAIVTRTQVGGADKDLAGVQTGQELGKIITQFYSYFSALYQLYARRMTMLKRSGYSKEAWARLATLFLLTGVAEPILSALFTRDTPEDDEDWATWAAQKVFFNPWNMVVVVRDVFNLVESSVDGFGGRSRAASLLTDVLETGERFRQQLMKGEDMEPRAALKAGWKNAGLLTGMVNAQELLALEAFWDWLEDSNPDFEWADLIRRKK